MAMDRQYSKAFFHSFIDAMQKLCRQYLVFDQAVELCGYLSLEIDNSKKERYVLSELVQNSGDVISESYCTKAFRTVRRNSRSPQRAEDSGPPWKARIIHEDNGQMSRDSGKPIQRDRSQPGPVFQTGGSFNRLGDHNTSSNNPFPSKTNQSVSGSRVTNYNQRYSPVESVSVVQRRHKHPHPQAAPEAVPVQMFTSKFVRDGPSGPHGPWQQVIPSITDCEGMDHCDGSGDGSRAGKRRATPESHMQTGSKKVKESPGSSNASTNASFPVSTLSSSSTHSRLPSSQSGPCDKSSIVTEDMPIIVKEEGVPFLIINPQDEDLETNGEGDSEVERLIQEGGVDNSCLLDGDAVGQLLEASLTEDMNKHTSRKTRGHVKLFQEYLVSQGITIPMHDLPPADLDSVLGTFFWDIRKDNGEEYEPSYLKNMQSSLERHLKFCGYSFCITRDKIFENSRTKLKDKQSWLIQQGKGMLPNKTVFLSEQDIDVLFRIQRLGDYNPDVLLNTIWLMVNINFGNVVKNVREHGDLLWRDIELQVDTSGRECVMLNKSPFPVVHVDNTVPSNRCLVRLYKTFRDSRGRYVEGTCPFYLCPNPTTMAEWFKPSPAGVNRLNNMVRRIVEGSGLPLEKKYTNSSIQMLIRGPLRTLAD
ncbi:uncharacterized protein LOC124141151 [Haliotis rufescens]|uniref:uncharacterized protein LOC124141151 n=1 Tax=Haliotis rufescens TaxID=6454 RepID=UPI00201F1797|nr:uncharacterized protein LOC124141151 [Haliotis rufescens]